MKNLKSIIKNNRGQTVVMSVFAIFALLAVLGLAIDLGRFVVVKAQLSKAVDGGALAGASILPRGQERARAAAKEYAQMNFSDEFMNTTDHQFRVHFNSNPTMATVGVRGAAQMPTMFLQLVGIRSVTVLAQAEAERRPLSVALVLDNSYSLDEDYSGADGIGFLREAAENFIWFFDDDMDKMALVLFSTGTVVPYPLQHDFTSSMTSTIRSMSPFWKTNLSDGFNAGYRELANDPDLASIQAMVYFTDGRPTALRDVFSVGGTDVDAVITADQNPAGKVANQLYEHDRLDRKMPGVFYTGDKLPDGSPRTSRNLQALANQRLLTQANTAREQGILIYTIALGNPANSEHWKQPDAPLLIQMANVPDGIDPRNGSTVVNPNYNPNQPEGGFFYAPDPTQLSVAFERVARLIVLRLTQ
jgi:Flp pilus assembly protein TadG